MVALQPTAETRAIEDHLAAQHRLLLLGRFAEVEASARQVIALAPDQAVAYNNLGSALRMRGDLRAAADAYSKAGQLDPSLRATTRRNLASVFAQLGERAQSLALCHAELRTLEGQRWMNDALSAAMKARDLSFAGELAAISAALRLGSEWNPRYGDTALQLLPVSAPARRISISKLRHDIQQFEYLQRQGVFGDELTPIIAEYHHAIERLSPLDEHAKIPIEGENLRAIGHVFGRIIHLRHTPRLLPRALSITYSERLAEAGIEPSVGSVGDSYDNALAETINGLHKTEVIRRRGPWRSFEAVEYATLEWVDWFNHKRLLEPIGNVPPAEAEKRYYAMLKETPAAA
jgi:transposase InsO family protein